MSINEKSNLRVTRRHILHMGLGSVIALATQQAKCATTTPAAEKPNILFLMADQYRADCVGAEGNRVILTPNLDRIAREGVLFRCAYSSVPSCTPARTGLLTGLSPWHHGMLGYGRVAEHYENEMPRMLSEAGYHTLGIGKMHWFPQRTLHGFHKTILDESGRAETPDFKSDYRQWFQQQAPDLNPDVTGIGWNEYAARPYALPERLHPTRWTGDQAIDFLQNYNQSSPFFLKVSFARPHSPYDAPEQFFKLYESANIPKAVIGQWAEQHAQREKKFSSSTWQGDLGEEQVRRSRQGYYGSVTFIDEQVGRILEVLEKRGWMKNTLILFTSDHGDMLGDHYLWRKTYAYESSARIPMLIRWPDSQANAKRGQILYQPVELRDVLPTFLDAAGITFNEKRFDGRSLLDLVRGKTAGWREFIDIEHDVCYSPENHVNALTDGRFKYIFNAFNGTQQLFDLKTDPGELHDLTSDPKYKETLLYWRRRLIEHLNERGEPFVVNGDLGLRPKGPLYSPNHPGLKQKT